jgi:membrane carboxypeptidase/penicillin-binding protein PbpC
MIEAIRSPGSTLKPLIYAFAFENGIAHPDTVLDDRPTHYGIYAPENFDHSFQGTVTARHALQMSLNLPAVELLAEIGPAYFIDIDAQFEELTVDLRSAPQLVLNTHSSDQIAHLFADPWPATARAGFPSPVRGEALSMPTHNSLGPDDGYGVKNARTATIGPNEQGGRPNTNAIGVVRAAAGHCWCRNTRISASSRRRDLKQSHSTQTKRKAIAIIRRSCSDSLLPASQMDEVFGSDTSGLSLRRRS